MAVIGIDIGEMNSLACVLTSRGIELVPNSDGEYITPTAVYFDDIGQVIVGKEAKEMLFFEQNNSFCDFMKNIGTDKKYFVIDKGVAVKDYKADELAGFVAKSLKKDAENYLGYEINEAVVAIPAYYSENQRLAVVLAVNAAGLKVKKVVSTSIASLLAYKSDVKSDDMSYMIFDFGGRTLDVSIIKVFDNMLEVQTVVFDNSIGGESFDEIIATNFYKTYNIYKENLTKQMREIIKNEARLCKMELSNVNSVKRTTYVDNKEYLLEMNNEKLKKIAVDVFNKIDITLQKALNDCSIEIEEIDKIIITGGAGMMPIIREHLYSLFGKKVVYTSVSDKYIAKGLGVVIANEERKGKSGYVILKEVCPFSIGIEMYDGTLSAIIDRNDPMPCSKVKYYNAVLSKEDKISFSIYCGENLRVTQNKYIGEIEFETSEQEQKEVEIEIRFTYDLKGVLDIDVKCLDNKKEIHKTIINSNICISENEVLDLLEELEKIKVHPKHIDENKLLIAKAEGLYANLGAASREKIMEALKRFELALDTQKERLIRSEFERFSLVLDIIEKNNFHLR